MTQARRSKSVRVDEPEVAHDISIGLSQPASDSEVPLAPAPGRRGRGVSTSATRRNLAQSRPGEAMAVTAVPSLGPGPES
jgi:hypothetical protein